MHVLEQIQLVWLALTNLANKCFSLARNAPALALQTCFLGIPFTSSGEYSGDKQEADKSLIHSLSRRLR